MPKFNNSSRPPAVSWIVDPETNTTRPVIASTEVLPRTEDPLSPELSLGRLVMVAISLPIGLICWYKV